MVTSSMSVHGQLTLFITPDRFYIVADNVSDEVIVIDRVTESVVLQGNSGQVPSTSGRREIFGVLGSIRLVGGSYLVVVTGRQRIGSINTQDVWKMTSAEVISYARTTTHLNEHQVRLEREYKSMIELVLGLPHFYFSYTYDLSHTLQRLNSISPDFFQMALHRRADQRFVWNHYLLQEFSKDDDTFAQYCLPIILGFVSIQPMVLNGRSMSLVVISRRSRHRAGARLLSRGVDALGNTSNFVETEQIVEAGGDRASFVQTRGSIPVYWEQYPNLRYKPRPKVTEGRNHREAFVKHFEAQILEYGRQVIVNLVNQSGSEGKLESFYRDMVQSVANPNIRYEAFDFHSECSRMRWDRLKLLMERLSHDQEQLGVMMRIRDDQLVSLQDGVFRTNCIDCLDRTNVVQSMLARRSLTYVLQRLQILVGGQKVEDQPGLESVMKAVWADNADAVSLQYSGTGALKTDFTRTGKRSWAGVLSDSINSATRYYRNNFTQGFLQDAMELFLGNYRVDPGEGVLIPSPLERHRGWRYFTFPLLFLVAMAMFFANVITPSDGSNTGEGKGFGWLIMWAAVMSSSFTAILINGPLFVDAPRLVPVFSSSSKTSRP